MKTPPITIIAVLLLATTTVFMSFANQRLQRQVEAATNVAERAIEAAKQWESVSGKWESVSGKWQSVSGRFEKQATNNLALLRRCLEMR